MALDLNPTMDAIGAKLLTITGPQLRVFDYLANNITPPAAIVAMPTVEYDHTKGRGTDKCVFPVHVLVSKVSDKASRDKLSEYIAGTGARSIKAVLESDRTLGGVVQNLRVMDATISVMRVGELDYLTATFQLEVWD